MTVCPICSKSFKQLHGSHLKLHNIATDVFKEKYPNISLRNENSYKTISEKKNKSVISDNIRCLHCNSLIEGNYRKIKKFCNSSCFASYNNLKKDKHKKICLQCNCDYYTSCGHSKFCSYKCSNINKRAEKVAVECDWCKITFQKKRSRINLSYKHFCKNECKRDYFKNNPNDRGIFHGHNGKSVKSSYRKIAFDNYEHKCYYCGYNKFVDVLQVHHIDENRNNNTLSNLQIVCPTCHSEIHKNYK